MKTARPYQSELIQKVIDEKSMRFCVCSPVGSGKTFIASKLIEHFTSIGKKVFFIVSRTSLIEQTLNHFDASLVKAGEEERFNKENPIQVIMLQTFGARDNLVNLLPKPDVLILDECHERLEGKQMTKLLEAYQDAKIIGLTATPMTEKGASLPFFEKVIQGPQVQELIDQGWLSPFRLFTIKYDLDLNKVAKTGGDYNQGQLSQTMLNASYAVKTAITKYVGTQKTLVFCVSIEHAERVKCDLEHIFKCEVLHSRQSKKEQEDILDRFRNNQFQILISVSMITTGFDVPDVECAVIARPTRIKRFFIQMCGRSTRINRPLDQLVEKHKNSIDYHT